VKAYTESSRIFTKSKFWGYACTHLSYTTAYVVVLKAQNETKQEDSEADKEKKADEPEQDNNSNETESSSRCEKLRKSSASQLAVLLEHEVHRSPYKRW